MRRKSQQRAAAARKIPFAEVERALAGSRLRLRFPTAIEQRFEAETGRARSLYLLGCGAIGLLLYDVFLLADYQLMPDIFFQAVIVRLALFTPFGLGILYLFSRNPAAWLRESLCVVASITAMASVMVLCSLSHSPNVVYAHYAMPLVIIFCNVVQRTRFWYACLASFGAFIPYALGVFGLENFPAQAIATSIFTMLSTIGFTLFANFHLEREQRRAYLIALRDELQSRRLMDTAKQLSRISNLDALTGLTNRRGFERNLESIWSEAVAGGESVAVLMFDVDHFKLFNDRYGHQTGDSCLMTLSDAARSQMRRDDDLIARYGGEEFVVVLPDADITEGVRVADRIRRAIEACGIPHELAPARVVTVSIGVAATPATKQVSPKELIESADTALYEAKSHGRNCVWPPLPPLPANVVPLVPDGGSIKVA